MEAQLNSLIDAVRQAGADGRVLRLRGGGSKDFWGQSLTGDVLDTRGYRGIVSHEPSELVVMVRCGTPLAELEAALAEKGQCLAFEPPHFGEGATVGGMLAAGLSGPARATAGAVRDYVLGARFINGLGEHLTFGGQVMKNVAGYDVSRLMAGSWGTLGLITEVSLKVLPVAPAEATLMCAGLPQKTALDLLHRWGGQPLPLNASAWVRDTTAQPVADYLFVRLRGAVAAVQSATTRMTADAVALGAQVTVMDKAEAAADWRASGEQTLPFFEAPAPDACLWRLSLPQTAPVLDLPGLDHPAEYIEWQGAQRWLWAPASAAVPLRELAQSVGGHATLFRASAAHAEVDKIAGVNTPLDAVQARIQQQLQQQFDPKGVFATGRMHPL
ncbi:glycolate oxidase subunit GlcE [Limnohabitans sp. MMS-10A-160]|uniref:glycolate oxidase subunit GlcE n=1 Tax=unclassified Limnohabitans TaxID=2626134 RepID=UPI000D3D345D|nr:MULTISPECIES: glycolate oxidase subunit GlcE [unclassified Limnohabitans]PUE20455.1 glycolate oxidase subunit GlcE [Limnohabitans sp. MMS-10A-192]PUE25158.1 glycolate oxidase subunit GlcE [Limnohabitans sp. MMS-10A-160]